MNQRVDNLINILDGYFEAGAHHININVFSKEKIKDAYEHPEKYGTMTVRVSGYCVEWGKLTQEQRTDIYHRTLHDSL